MDYQKRQVTDLDIGIGEMFRWMLKAWFALWLVNLLIFGIVAAIGGTILAFGKALGML